MENETKPTSVFQIQLSEAQRIRDHYEMDLNAYFDFIDLLQETYMKGYNEGVEMVKKVHQLGEYKNK